MPSATGPARKYYTLTPQVTAVDDLLTDVPWRRRRELIAGLRDHLRESPN